jgi:tRNA 2-thiouridine synthesizing protein A
MKKDPIHLKKLACSLPLVKLAAAVKCGKPGEVIEAVSDNPGFADDIRAWCAETGNEIRSIIESGGLTTVAVRKTA